MPVRKNPYEGILTLSQQAQQNILDELNAYAARWNASQPQTAQLNLGSAPNVDYLGIAKSLPTYQQGMADLAAEDVADKARFGGDYARALVEFGVVPENWQDPLGAVNPQVRGAAQANTESGISTFARIQKQHMDQIKNLRRKLAARGMLRSGDLTHGQGEVELDYRQKLSDAQSKLLNYFAGIQAAYAQATQSRYGQQRNLLNDAYEWARQHAGISETPRPAAGTIGPQASYTMPVGGGPIAPGATAPDFFANLANMPVSAFQPQSTPSTSTVSTSPYASGMPVGGGPIYPGATAPDWFAPLANIPLSSFQPPPEPAPEPTAPVLDPMRYGGGRYVLPD